MTRKRTIQLTTTRREFIRTAALSTVASAMTARSYSQTADPSLKPGAVVQFTFPDLPPTLHAKFKNDPAPAMLTAQLPDNYTTEGRWPLFVNLHGGQWWEG